jgi:hypothetical protein
LTDDDGSLRRALRAHGGVRELQIDQATLTKGTRIRRTVDLGSSETLLEFAFKRKVGGHVVEIQTEVSKADFDRLWSTRESAHAKTRFAYVERDLGWDIDYFGKLKNPYFVRAEAEMPERMWDATRTPAPSDVIADYVLHVAGKDQGFTSGRLADEKYATKLLKQLRAAAARRREREPVRERSLAFG